MNRLPDSFLPHFNRALGAVAASIMVVGLSLPPQRNAAGWLAFFVACALLAYACVLWVKGMRATFTDGLTLGIGDGRISVQRDGIEIDSFPCSDVLAIGRTPFRKGIAVAIRGRPALSVPESMLAHPSELDRLAGALRVEIAKLPGGETRLAELQQAPDLEIPRAVSAVIGLLLCVFVLQQLTTPDLVTLGASGRGWSLGEPWRLLSAGMLHVGWLHLGSNALTLLLAGVVAETCLGGARSILLVGLGSIVAIAASMVFHPEGSVTLGASGGIYALVAAAIVVPLRDPSRAPPTARFPLALLFLVLAQWLYFDRAMDGVDWVAHVAGAASGTALAFLWTRRRRAVPPAERRLAWLVAAAYVATAVFLGYRMLTMDWPAIEDHPHPHPHPHEEPAPPETAVPFVTEAPRDAA